MKLYIAALLFLICSSAWGEDVSLPYGMDLSVSGYVGWKQIISDVKFDSIKSEPELGITTALNITDRLVLFNQLKWGTKIDDIFVYNNLAYTPDIPIDDFSVTIKAGRILHDTFLYNATRINPRTRQGVFQPQTMAWDTFGRAITSGTGVGLDFNYKRLSASYVIDKMTVVNPDQEAQSWANDPMVYDLKAKGWHNQLFTIGYDLCEYHLKLKAWAEKENFSVKVKGFEDRIVLGGEHIGAGAEWSYNPFVISFEMLATKRDSVNWGRWEDIFIATSTTIEYDINDDWTVRANYNQYKTPTDTGPEVSRYSKDANIGVNWHHGQYMVGLQGNYIQGGRLVYAQNVVDNPDDYKKFWVVGFNVVYFFD